MNDFKTKVNVEDFAYAIAHAYDTDQATFLNTFAIELKVCCQDPKLDGSQPCNIARKLDKNGVELIKSLYEFIKLREEAKP